MVTLDELKSLHSTNEKIDKLARAYYEEFVVLRDDYEFLKWELIHRSDQNYSHYEWDDGEEYKVLIIYSYLDCYDNRTNDWDLISIDLLNGVIEYNEQNLTIFYNGNKI